MYAVSEPAARAWYAILRRVSELTEVPLKIIDFPPPLPLEDLWSRSDLGAVFMCGYPFILAGQRHQLIAAPVPAPRRYGGRAVYYTDFIVHRDSPFTTLEQTFGKTIAWTVAHSHSGFNAVRFHLLNYLKPGRNSLFSHSLGPVFTPHGAVQSILEGKADVAPLDSWVHDIWKSQGDSRISKIRVVESSVASPIPPLVASPHVSRNICDKFRRAFISLNASGNLSQHFATLNLSHFSTVKASDYNIIAAQATKAEEMGYSTPA